MVGFLEILKAVSLENRNEKKTKDWFVQAQTILHRFQGRGGLFFKPLPLYPVRVLYPIKLITFTVLNYRILSPLWVVFFNKTTIYKFVKVSRVIIG